MRKSFAVLLLPVVLVSCKPNSKTTCEYKVNDSELQIYNDVLIELVEDHFYGLYLGDANEALLTDWNKIESPDSTDWLEIKEKQTVLHNNLFGDTASFNTIYLTNRHDLSSRFDDFTPSILRATLQEYDADNKEVLKQISQAQTKYSAADFRACTFSIDSLGAAKSIFELEPERKSKTIGQISFSKLYLKGGAGKGFLYYEFFCGTKCGKGELIVVKREAGRWRVVDKVQLWIS